MVIVICDDNPDSRSGVHGSVQRWKDCHQSELSISILDFSSTEDLLEAWMKGLEIDLLFLDIQIPGEMSGLELARTIRAKNSYVNIVFVTNYAEFACEGYNVSALRYLKKPVNDDQISECIDISYRQWYYSQGSYAFLFESKNTIIIPYKHIFYFESKGHYMVVYTIDREPFQMRITVKELQNRLPSESFTQCHKGFIVNLQYVRGFCSDSITMANGTIVPVGRKYADPFFSALQRYFQGEAH